MSDKTNLRNDNAKNWHAKGYYGLVKTAGVIDAKVKKALKPKGVTHVQLNILSLLINNHPEPLCAKSIKEKLIVQSPDLTRILDRLVNKGLVDRKTCPENRRKIDINITEEGIALYEESHNLAKEAVNNFFADDITEDEAKELYRILNKISI